MTSEYFGRPPRAALALVLFALLLACGCSGRPKTFAVTGTVTYHGQPIEGARVMFIPQNNRGAVGTTDAQGRFTLLSFAAGDGAVLGEHVVCIAKAVRDANDSSGSPYHKSHWVLPERYATPLKSPLRATVTAGGPNDFPFDLVD